MAKMKTNYFSIKKLYYYLILLLLETHFLICNSVQVLGSNSFVNTDLNLIPKRVCSGTIIECLSATETEMEMEMEMDSGSNRRILAMQKRYISYDTLKKDMIPCARPGSSYYNCPATGQGNPYSRGCEVITRCARDTHQRR
ncbi:protein RALF-like 33 [Macadamia integrifolia]|uniref:protein RALF-like 33 n=1 Tax=Macadamia integrifolia TaxID=60698 RepID=UPI001C4E9F80|nr:protein RALF-like 33 [Macadamia integrifolia]